MAQPRQRTDDLGISNAALTPRYRGIRVVLAIVANERLLTETLGQIDSDEYAESKYAGLPVISWLFASDANRSASGTTPLCTKAVNSPSDVPLLNAYRPVKARIITDD